MKNVFLRIDKRDKNYECFGWWLSDLLSDAERPSGISEPNGNKTDKIDNDGLTHLPGPQLTSEEDLASGNQSHMIEANENTLGLDSNTTANKKCAKIGIAKNGTKCITSSKATSMNKTPDDSTLSNTQVAALIRSPNHKQPERILYQSPKSEHQFKTSRPAYESSGYLSGTRTRLQDGDRKVLCPLVELQFTIEHDTDRQLEVPREKFLQAVGGLDSKIRTLQADNRQLHTDLNALLQDFQVSGMHKQNGEKIRFSVVGR